VWDNTPDEGAILVKILKGHSLLIKDLILLSNGNLASCSYDETIRIWGTTKDNFKCLHILKGHTDKVNVLYELPNKILISTC